MLQEKKVTYHYREYTQEPLTEGEITEILAKLNLTARDVLRGRDAKKAGLSGEETDAQLIALMADNPRLLQRPIGVLGNRAVLGRPPEALLTLL